MKKLLVTEDDRLEEANSDLSIRRTIDDQSNDIKKIEETERERKRTKKAPNCIINYRRFFIGDRS